MTHSIINNRKRRRISVNLKLFYNQLTAHQLFHYLNWINGSKECRYKLASSRKKADMNSGLFVLLPSAFLNT